MKALSLLGTLAIAATITACSADAPSAPTAVAVSSTAAAKGAGGGGGGTPAPVEFYTGRWVQSPSVRVPFLDGWQEQVTIVTITQKGTTIDGSASLYITDFDANGNVTLPTINVGSPGKVTGTVTATGLSMRIDRLGESRTAVGYTFALSADSTTLNNINPTAFGIASLVR